MADDIAQLLEGLGLGQYAQAFAENDVDIKNLVLLSDDDLKELGLSMGHRRTLLVALKGDPTERQSQEPAKETTDPAPSAPEAERRQLTVMFVLRHAPGPFLLTAR